MTETQLGFWKGGSLCWGRGSLGPSPIHEPPVHLHPCTPTASVPQACCHRACSYGGALQRAGRCAGTAGEWPDFMRRERPATEKEKEVAAEVEAAAGPDDPWGLGSLDSTEQVNAGGQGQG
jgi:hypothetical protein